MDYISLRFGVPACRLCSPHSRPEMRIDTNENGGEGLFNKKGFLFLRTKVMQNWKCRWFSLDGINLRCFQNDRTTQALDVIPLFNPNTNKYATIIFIKKDRKDRKNMFALAVDGVGQHIFSASTPTERENWINSISAVLAQHQKTNDLPPTPVKLSPALLSPKPNRSKHSDYALLDDDGQSNHQESNSKLMAGYNDKISQILNQDKSDLQEKQKKKKEREQMEEEKRNDDVDRYVQMEKKKMEEEKREEERKRQEEERRREEEEKKRQEEERRREEEEKKRQEEERKRQEEKRRIEEEKKQEEERKIQEEKRRMRRIVRIQSLWRARIVRKHFPRLITVYKRRQKIAQELMSTEQSYLSSLQTLSQLYIAPLLVNNIIDGDTCRIAFSNANYLVFLHKEISKKIEERVNSWYPQQKFGDIFVEALPDLKNFYSQYVVNYNKSIATVKNLISTNPAFQTFVEDCMKDPRGNDLHLTDYLIMPVQRLPRYEMLLADLLRNTPQTAEDKTLLESALSGLREVNAFVNNHTREVQSMERVLHVQNKLSGAKKNSNLYQPGRELIREGLLIMIGKAGESERTVFLFNDSVMVSKKTSTNKNVTLKYDFKANIPLKGATVVMDYVPNKLDFVKSPSLTDTTKAKGSPKLGNGESHVIALITADGSKYVFRASNANDKKGWYNAMDSAIKALPKEAASASVPRFSLSSSRDGL
ncbi:hypothetical protein PROFUN_13685 [Planoprotostelium fungivorum]|uniref:RhoGEF domain containing protein n=1 Tax=Planoprotostelium fungivorum TaxID=1890364 RepID=A0A2P6N3E4_9EUKA|nr:hypothetical protein PROFUN_13685 [Planoprotostelium fungivorum]